MEGIAVTNTRRGNRFSSLPIAQYCPHAPRHGAQAGGGRAAVMSSAFHARCAREPGWQDKWHRLTKEEQDEIDTWKKPADIGVPGSNVILRYEDAYLETPMGLDENGRFVEKDDPSAIAFGTADFYWVHDDVVYMGDIKRTEWTTSDGVESLQIVGYAFAAMAKHGAAGFQCAVWSATGGAWEWGELYHEDVNMGAMRALWNRVKAAAMHTDGDYAIGAHCKSCYGRTHCPQYLIPPELAETSLAPFTEHGVVLSNEQAHQLLMLCDRAETVADRVRDLLKHHVRDNGPIVDPVSGKHWKPIQQKGRESFDVARFEREYPGVYEAFTKRGAPSESFRWVKGK